MRSVSGLTHVTSEGTVRMVDVTSKPSLLREAIAAGEIRMQPTTLDRIERQAIAKGNVFATARLSGILAAKRTGDLIPLCHTLSLQHCDVECEIAGSRDRIVVRAIARTLAPTGVEMEALTAVSLALLTIYDMCKAVDKTMVMGAIRLLEKTKRDPRTGELVG